MDRLFDLVIKEKILEEAVGFSNEQGERGGKSDSTCGIQCVKPSPQEIPDLHENSEKD